LDSDFVSGNLPKGNGSPDGVFKIVYKERDATLVGEDYKSSVDYFMPFAYNVGFHDASWRSTFGGEIYLTKGSHGCINLPHDIAETLYNELEVDTPVVAFYRDEVQLTAENAKISNAFSYVDPETLNSEETE
jgi:lipoprotein-anchoring transpeptidase ErfK/SrfK